MEENILLSKDPLPPGEAKLVSESHLVDPSNLADLKPIQFTVNGLSETKVNMFHKMDIDNHNITIENSSNSEVHKCISSANDSVFVYPEIDNSSSLTCETVSKPVEIIETKSVPNESISEYPKTNNTNYLPGQSISEHSEIVNTKSLLSESISNHCEKADTPVPCELVSAHSEAITGKISLPDKVMESVDTSQQVTPGKSRYGRVRRPKLSVDFVSVDKKSFAVLNSSSYEFPHVNESHPSATPVAKKKRSYVRKSIVQPGDDSDTTTLIDSKPKSKEQIQKSMKAETAKLKTEFSTTNSDVYLLDESSISSLNSNNIKTYSRRSETSVSSEDRQSGAEDNKDPLPVNYTELNWKVGDVAWAKVGCYPYWPSIVTLEYGSSIYAKSVGKRGNRLAVHVQFFGDRGRRSWVLTTSLIKYESKEQFLELKSQYSRDKLKFKYFNIIRAKELWEKAIIEADTILKLPHEERIQYYQSIYPVSEEIHAAEMVANKLKRTSILKLRKNFEERRGRKRKILDESDNVVSLKKRKKLANLSASSKASAIRGEMTIPRRRGRPPKKLRNTMDEHLRKRRSFERRLKKLMHQATGEKKANTNIDKNKKSHNVENVKFDLLVKNEKPTASDIAKNSEPKKKSGLSVYDFESDEETDVFLGTYNSRYTPHLLAKIEEKKSNEDADSAVLNSNAGMNSIESEVSDKVHSDDKSEKNDGHSDIQLAEKNEFSITDANFAVNPKRGRGRPKGSKKVETLMRPKEKRGRGRPRKNHLNRGRPPKIHRKLTLRQRRKAFLKSEQNMLSKKQLSEMNDFNDSVNEQTKKVHPKKRLLEKSRRSEKISKALLAENEEVNVKVLPDENTKGSKRSPSMSSKEDLDSDDDDLKVIQPDTEEGKRRSSSPQAPRSKKSSALFSGFKFEKVCLVCEKPGDTVRCRGPCSGTYHIECVSQTEKVEVKSIIESVVVSCKPRRGRPPRTSSTNLVSANESGEMKNSIVASSDERQSDSVAGQEIINNINNEKCSLPAGAEVIVTKAAEDATNCEVSSSGLPPVINMSSVNELQSVSAAAKMTGDDETNALESEEIAEKLIDALVSFPETQKMNDNEERAEVTSVITELTNSVIESEMNVELSTALMNGHCDFSNSGDANARKELNDDSMNSDTDTKHLVDKGLESEDAKHKIIDELNISFVNERQQNVEIKTVEVVRDNCSTNLNDHVNDENFSSDKNCPIQDELVSRNVNPVLAMKHKPHSCNADANNMVVDESISSCTEEKLEFSDVNEASRLKSEKPNYCAANVNDLTVQEQSDIDLQIEEDHINSTTDVDHQVEKGPECCDDGENLQREKKSNSGGADTVELIDGEKVCDVVKDEENAVPIIPIENEETGSSDACSENMSCSTKTDSSIGVDFRCNKCSENKLYPCFTCGKDVEEKTGESERYSCYLASCGRVYHKECLKAWPQATWRGNNRGKLIRNGSSLSRNAVISKETLMCPQHYCHTCISENPAVLKNRHCNDTLIRCIRCPTAYHRRVHCIPAGTEILTMSQIICPRHYEPPVGAKNTVHFNTSWCFICCIGGSLICCDECPTSFHAECLQLRPEEYEGRYICDDCQCGRHLLYGEIAWVKLGHYRWWPAKILYPNEVPENIQNLPHRRGEFVVQFYGSHDYNWVNRGRAFLYQEGDSGKKNSCRNAVDLSFEKAIQEAEEAYEKLKIVKAARDEETRMGLKPPKYVNIKSNKPVGNVRIVELNTSNITACECDPKSERPCGPDSDCINRMLLVECNPLVCPAGDRCNNQAFEKRVYPPLIPYNTDKRGWGLKTLVDIKKGDFIIEYVGEMIDEEEYKRRVSIMHKNQEDNYYFLTIDKDRMLDAGPKGNVARFMNHSCDPNCETQKWTVNGDTRVGLFALKDISADTELVFNYNLATQGNEMKPCFCGSDKCSGFIGVKATKNGSSSFEDELRKRSNEGNDDEARPRKKKLRRGRPKKIVRKHILSSKKCAKKSLSIAKISRIMKSKGATNIKKMKKIKKKKKKKKKMMRKTTKTIVSRFNKWSVIDTRFKSKGPRSRISGSSKKNVESLLKHRELLKQRTMAKQEEARPIKAKKVEHRGRKKTPKNEEEKQTILFEMMRKRIQRKIEEMTLCKLDEKCFVCGRGEAQDGDELLFCDNNKCPKGYHLQCLNLTKWPSGRWLCPWHYCTVCRSIRKVLKCEECVNSYCFLHVSENLFKKNDGPYLCKQHQASSCASSATMQTFEKEIKVEITDMQDSPPDSTTINIANPNSTVSDTSAVSSPIASTATTTVVTPATAKRPRGRPKGSKSHQHETANDNVRNVTVKTKPTPTPKPKPKPMTMKKKNKKKKKKTDKKLSAKVAIAKTKSISSKTTSSLAAKKAKLKEKLSNKKRQLLAAAEKKKIVEKKVRRLQTGDVGNEKTTSSKKIATKSGRPSGKVVVEGNVKFDVKNGRGGSGGGGSSTDAAKVSEAESDECRSMVETMDVTTTSPTRTNAQDSDESFGSYVATEVTIVDEVAENISPKEYSELSEYVDPSQENNVAAENIETSDDEYDNLEVEVINGEDSN